MIDPPQRVPCGAAMFLHPQIATHSGVNMWDDTILLIQRTGAHGDGTWAVPGGWLDPGEGPLKAAIRETWEEVGVTVEDAYPIGFTHDLHPEGVEDVCLWYRATRWTGRPRPVHPDKILKVEWHSLDNLPHPLFTALQNGLDLLGSPPYRED